jgi:hypothetical protein
MASKLQARDSDRSTTLSWFIHRQMSLTERGGSAHIVSLVVCYCTRTHVGWSSGHFYEPDCFTTNLTTEIPIVHVGMKIELLDITGALGALLICGNESHIVRWTDEPSRYESDVYLVLGT